MNEYGFNTGLLHGTNEKYPQGATQVPIYQSSAFRHDSAEDLEKIFDNKKMGFSYTRINNPTVESFEKRVTMLEDGIGSVACASAEGGNLNTPFQQFTHKTIFRTRSHSHAQSFKNGHTFLVYPFISILISAVRLYAPCGHLHILTAELNSVHSFKHVRLTRTLTFPKLLRTSLVPYSLYFPGFIWPDSD